MQGEDSNESAITLIESMWDVEKGKVVCKEELSSGKNEGFFIVQQDNLVNDLVVSACYDVGSQTEVFFVLKLHWAVSSSIPLCTCGFVKGKDIRQLDWNKVRGKATVGDVKIKSTRPELFRSLSDSEFVIKIHKDAGLINRLSSIWPKIV